MASLETSERVFAAAKGGDTTELRRLIAEEGAAEVLNVGNKERYGCKPLHYAAWNGMAVSCDILVGAGAEVDCLDSYGRTPMHFAARMGHTAVVERLVALGGDVHTKQQLGATPLHYAAIEGNTVTCQKLLKLGADVSATNDSGSSALALAGMKDNVKTIEYLAHATKKRAGGRGGGKGAGFPRTSISRPQTLSTGLP